MPGQFPQRSEDIIYARILDMCRTTVNVAGNLVLATVIARKRDGDPGPGSSS